LDPSHQFSSSVKSKHFDEGEKTIELCINVSGMLF
jgi:hypothetical protein